MLKGSPVTIFLHLYMIKAAIPRFSIWIRMRISIRIRKVSMRTPYFTFQYPSNVYVCLYLTLNSAYVISLSHENSTLFIQNVVIVNFFIIYKCPIARIRCIRYDYGFDRIMRNYCEFANLTPNHILNNVEHFLLYWDVQTFLLYWRYL